MFNASNSLNQKKMRIMIKYLFAVIFCIAAYPGESIAQDPKEILHKAIDHLNGEYNQGEMKMTIVRPTWTREVTMKTWSKGTIHSLILITDPARDKGTAFLKRDKEIWNWQPKIDRSIKLPPSMMMQSWMGSDFTNDDLVKQSSMEDDYTHKLLANEMVGDRECYQIELIPMPDAAVVWGKVVVWIDVKDYLQLKTEFFDEDGYRVHTMTGKNIDVLGGKLLPTKMELIPEDEPDNKTMIEYLSMDFSKVIPESFFTVQNMKRVR